MAGHLFHLETFTVVKIIGPYITYIKKTDKLQVLFTGLMKLCRLDLYQMSTQIQLWKATSNRNSTQMSLCSYTVLFIAAWILCSVMSVHVSINNRFVNIRVKPL